MTQTSIAGSFPIHKGNLLSSRYEVQAFLGEGSFGKVAKCFDIVTNTMVAIKITKEKPFFTERALQEIRILKQLQNEDPDRCHLVRWNGSFFHERLLCLPFELLDLSLHQYMQQRHFKPLSISEIRPVLRQLTTALLHLEALEIMHADLKPENIMIVDHRQQPMQVKLIDFGLARHVSEAVPGTCVQSLWYRAPEVMLGLVYTESIDMWSLGLVAAELAVGFPVFPAKHEYDLMKFIVDTLGQPPDYQLNCGSKSTQFFNIQGSFNQQTWGLKTPEEFSRETGHHFIDTRCFWSLNALEKMMYFRNRTNLNKLRLFLDLLKKMLLVDKNGRIIPLKVLEHSFFSLPPSSQNSTEDLMINAEGSKVTEQPSSQESNKSFTIIFHGETPTENVKLEDVEVVEDKESKKKPGSGIRIRKVFSSCWRRNTGNKENI